MSALALPAVIRAARRRQRRRRIVLAVGLILAAAVVAGVHLSTRHAGTGRTAAAAPRLTLASFRLHGAPVALATAGGSLWVVLETGAGRQAELVRLDPASGRRMASYPIGRSGPDFGAAAADGGVVYATAGTHVIRVDAQHPGGITRARIPGYGAALAVGYGSVWVASIAQAQAGYTLSRLEPRTLARLHAIPLGVQPVALQAGLGSVWLASTSSLWRIDPATNSMRPTSVALYPGAAGAALSDGRLWVRPYAMQIAGIDRAGRVRDRIDLPFNPGAIAVSGTNVWVTDNCACVDGRVALIDSRTGRVLGMRHVGETPVAVTTARRGAWVATFADGSVSRVVETR